MNRERTIVLWCPDWPIRAARSMPGLPPEAPLALIDRGLVFACSPEARRVGVRRGLTVREAQFRCTDLVVRPYDPALDRRVFEPVLDGLEQVTPGLAVLRPGTCALRARGPVRYYGGEVAAALAMLDTLRGAGLTDCRVGIADGPFAAEQAARRGLGRPSAAANGAAPVGQQSIARVQIIPPGESAAFLAPLPVSVVVDVALGTLLARLGVHTLAQFAALPARDVHQRFGAAARQAHARASGREHEEVVPRTPTPVFDRGQEFEPALERIDQLAFALRGTADAFVQVLREHTLVCTGVSILVGTEDGLLTERTWRHPRWFTASDLIDRLRWQLQGHGRADTGLAAAVMRVVFRPDQVDAVENHEDGLWGTGPDERIHHALTRVQGLVGHTGVVTAAIGPGRMLADRQRWVPWGDDAPATPGGDRGRAADRTTGVRAQPWSGSLRDTFPATVYRARHPVTLVAADGSTVSVDDRGSLNGEPQGFSPDRSAAGAAGNTLLRVTAWAGPWPVLERWWDADAERRAHRMQVVDENDEAWLLVLEDDGWRAEGRYD